MRTTRFLPAVILLVITATADAGPFRRCHRIAPRYSCAMPVSPCRQTTYSAPGAVHAAPQAVAPAPTPQAFGYSTAPGTSEAGAFLAALNAWRAANARPPLSWDASLASYAASNAGVHAGGSSGGAMQCWASSPSLTAALRQWIASPAHAAILLSATTSVGASPCPSGSTANAR